MDGQQTILEAELIKTKEEVDLVEISIAIVEAACWEAINKTHPGTKESDTNGMMREVTYRLGGEEIQNINVISGNRSYPHPHDASDRILRMGICCLSMSLMFLTGIKPATARRLL